MPSENKPTANVERGERWPSLRSKTGETDSVNLKGIPDELLVASNCTATK
jgi:hypothetical protein